MVRSGWAILASSTLILVSGLALADAHQLQSRLDRAAALDRARVIATESLNAGSGTAAHIPLRRLLKEARGFKFLAVRDANGSVRAAAGLYENIVSAGLSADTMQQLREALYSLTSQYGRLRVQTDTVSGELEYALSDTLRAEVHDQALVRLSRYAALGLFCGGVFMLWAWHRRDLPMPLQWQSRARPVPVDTPVRPSSVASSVSLPVTAAPASPSLSEAALDQVREAIVCTDDAGVIRYANARVVERFGYSREALFGDSLGKLLPVPFLNDASVRLADYLAGGSRATQPRVVGWSASAQSFAVEIRVERLGPNSLAVFLTPVD